MIFFGFPETSYTIILLYIETGLQPLTHPNRHLSNNTFFTLFGFRLVSTKLDLCSSSVVVFSCHSPRLSLGIGAFRVRVKVFLLYRKREVCRRRLSMVIAVLNRPNKLKNKNIYKTTLFVLERHIDEVSLDAIL